MFKKKIKHVPKFDRLVFLLPFCVYMGCHFVWKRGSPCHRSCLITWVSILFVYVGTMILFVYVVAILFIYISRHLVCLRGSPSCLITALVAILFVFIGRHLVWFNWSPACHLGASARSVSAESGSSDKMVLNKPSSQKEYLQK